MAQENKIMTYQQAAQTALDCQTASNLSGVAKSLAGPVMAALWAEADRTKQGTDWINKHPIVTLMLDKLASLNGSQYGGIEAFSKANEAVLKIAPHLHELHVDGTSIDEGLLTGASGEDDKTVRAPFYVFDASAQENVAGPYLTYAEAEANRTAIKEGREAAPATTTDDEDAEDE